MLDCNKIDLSFYRKSHPDLKFKSDKELIKYFELHGAKMGQWAHPHQHTIHFIESINRYAVSESKLILEIGPGWKPRFKKNTKYDTIKERGDFTTLLTK